MTVPDEYPVAGIYEGSGDTGIDDTPRRRYLRVELDITITEDTKLANALLSRADAVVGDRDLADWLRAGFEDGTADIDQVRVASEPGEASEDWLYQHFESARGDMGPE